MTSSRRLGNHKPDHDQSDVPVQWGCLTTSDVLTLTLKRKLHACRVASSACLVPASRLIGQSPAFSGKNSPGQKIRISVARGCLCPISPRVCCAPLDNGYWSSHLYPAPGIKPSLMPIAANRATDRSSTCNWGSIRLFVEIDQPFASMQDFCDQKTEFEISTKDMHLCTTTGGCRKKTSGCQSVC